MHQDGDGYNIVLQALPIDGKIVLRLPKDDKRRTAAAGARTVRTTNPALDAGSRPATARADLRAAGNPDGSFIFRVAAAERGEAWNEPAARIPSLHACRYGCAYACAIRPVVTVSHTRNAQAAGEIPVDISMG